MGIYVKTSPKYMYQGEHVFVVFYYNLGLRPSVPFRAPICRSAGACSSALNFVACV